MSPLDEARRAVLRALCDSVVPRLQRDGDHDGFWARGAVDVGADQVIEQLMETMPPAQRDGLGELLDALAQLGFPTASQESREQLLRNLALAGPEAAAGGAALTGLTLFLTYGNPDPQTGLNPFWERFGYPGPGAVEPGPASPVQTTEPDGDELELEADVVIVGSGAGGGVIAGTLAQQGLSVVVVEAGGRFEDADFPGYELWAYQSCYWRGGPQQTADLNVTLQAGATLGGGTTINWQNCLRTKAWVREEWAREHGLEGVDGPDFDRHLDAVEQRISANDDCSERNGPNARLAEGAQELGWSLEAIVRNADPQRHDPAHAGHVGFGDRSGAKQSTLKTYLTDAAQHGARFVTRCFAERVLVEGGRAAGIEGLWTDPQSGRSARVTVRAPRVVVAAGALESPALLLRSGIGGPAVGANLRLHPCTAVFASYGEDQRAWWGGPQTALVDEFAAVEDGHGFLLECTQYAPGLAGSALPFTTAAAHKEQMSRFRFGATFIGLIRDRGAGMVTIDEQGLALPLYSLTDDLDVRNSHRALDAQIRLHVAAGAREIRALATGAPTWRSGEDVEAFIARVQRIPLRAGGHRLFSAHQMGTCRMGTGAATSVAGPFGELHDTPGVWIGDASAFPTASGTNPMLTIMALARRTAEAIAGTRADQPAATAGANA